MAHTPAIALRPEPGDADHPPILVSARGFLEQLGNNPYPVHLPPAEVVVALDELVNSGAVLVSAAYALATDLFQGFGWPDAHQLTRDGQLRRAGWDPDWHHELDTWASTAGIDIM